MVEEGQGLGAVPLVPALEDVVHQAVARAELLVDDSTGYRAVLLRAIVEIREDLAPELPRFRAIREKHGIKVPSDEEHLRTLAEEGRVMLAITPDGPPSTWTSWGLD